VINNHSHFSLFDVALVSFCQFHFRIAAFIFSARTTVFYIATATHSVFLQLYFADNNQMKYWY